MLLQINTEEQEYERWKDTISLSNIKLHSVQFNIKLHSVQFKIYCTPLYSKRIGLNCTPRYYALNVGHTI